MSDESDIIQSVYAVTVDPERYDDLVVTWVEKLSTALFAYQDNPRDADSRALNEHVERAEKVISLLAASRADDVPGEQKRYADPFPEAQPAMRIDASGTLLDANASARSAYSISEAGTIADLPFDPAALRTIQALAAKLARNAHLKPSPVSSASPSAEAEFETRSVPLVRAVRTDNQQTVYLSIAVDSVSPVTLLLTSTDIVWPDRLTTLMRDSFELTAAECDVGKRLVEGASLATIAQQRHNSMSTIRVHARSLLNKTSTNSQREFIRMAIGLATLYPDIEPEPAAVPTSQKQQATVLPEAHHWQRLVLRDGRELPYALLGPAKGRLCLYVHDALFGPVLPQPLVDLALSQGLQILFVARQGWMGAAFHSRGVNAFEQCARDTKELMDHLRFDNVLLIGRVLGATYAFEIARHDPSRYLGLLGITPALPIGNREDINKMAPHHRLLTVAIGANTILLKFVTRAGMAIYDRFGADRFLRMIYRSSPEDLKILNTPEYFTMMSESMALSGGGAHHPFYQELRDRPSTAWHPGLELPVPFHALLGEKDPSARLRRAERMIDRGVPLTLTLQPDVGELFVYSHPELVVAAIESMFEDAEGQSQPAASHKSGH